MNRIFDPVQPIDLAVEPAPDPPQPFATTPGPTTGPTSTAPQASLSAHPPAPGPSAGAPATSIAAAAAVERGSSLLMATASAAGLTAAAAAASTPPARSGAVASPRSPRPGFRSGFSAAPRGTVSLRRGRPDERQLLIGALCGVCLASVAGSLLFFGHWTRLQQNIAQERNLLLLERLRSLGPATPTPVSGPEPAAPILPAPPSATAPGAEGLPPPPPQEAWIEQLSTLPPAAPTPPRVLTVPVSPRLAQSSAGGSAAPSARASGTSPVRASGTPSAAPSRAAMPLPQLVGVVAGAGRAPSAIFLVGGSSMSVGSGELIGSTGWRLRSAEGETALIERGGELRQVSIASGNGF